MTFERRVYGSRCTNHAPHALRELFIAYGLWCVVCVLHESGCGVRGAGSIGVPFPEIGSAERTCVLCRLGSLGTQ